MEFTLHSIRYVMIMRWVVWRMASWLWTWWRNSFSTTLLSILMARIRVWLKLKYNVPPKFERDASVYLLYSLMVSTTLNVFVVLNLNEGCWELRLIGFGWCWLARLLLRIHELFVADLFLSIHPHFSRTKSWLRHMKKNQIVFPRSKSSAVTCLR